LKPINNPPYSPSPLPSPTGGEGFSISEERLWFDEKGMKAEVLMKPKKNFLLIPPLKKGDKGGFG